MASIINLLIPGGGLILVNGVATGLFVGAVFTVVLALTLTAIFVAPLEFPPVARNLLIGASAGAYLAAQWRMQNAARAATAERRLQRRRADLLTAMRAVAAEDYSEAEQRLADLAAEYPHDLLIAYRLAILKALRGAPESEVQAAWERVRRLDRHRVYKSEWGAATPARRGAGDLGGGSGV